MFATTDRPPQVIVITSPTVGDGKSTTSSNLAVTVAQQGTRVLLIDADLRRGCLHEVFNVQREPGLTNVLRTGASLETAIQHVEIAESGQTLQFLATGVRPPNPAELLGTARMREVLAQLRERYELIIFDAPPLNLVTDAAVLGTMADATLMVIRAGVTNRPAIQHAAIQLHRLRMPVGGVILNDFEAGSAYSYYTSYT
jgi:capsular exopolysaccharide synthesis family protein